MRYLPVEQVYRFGLAMHDARRYPVSLIWRAQSFGQTEGRPMTWRQAAALSAILARAELPILPGELLLGSGCTKCATGGSAGELQTARAYLNTIGSRHFLTNYDHVAPNYAEALRSGLSGLQAKTIAALERQDDPDRRCFLESVLEALRGAIFYLERWAEAAGNEALRNPEWRELLLWQANMLWRLAQGPAQTFWEALQLTYLIHCMFQLDSRYAMAFGRLDQFLYPYYQEDLRRGRIAPAQAQVLLDHFFAKVAHRNDIQNICIGGVDSQGQDATNELSFMCLEACRRVGQPGGNITARIHRHTPDAFLLKCAEVIRSGIGFPAVFSDEIQIPALTRQGYPPAHARDYCFVGCIEVAIAGRQGPWSDSRFNLLRCVDLALRNGIDGLTGRRAGPATGEPETWEGFVGAYLRQLHEGLEEHIDSINRVKLQAQERASELTSPLLSVMIEGCIERGLDVNNGGALYPGNHGVAGMGIGSTADSLVAIKRLVYEQKRFTLPALRTVLDANFAGYSDMLRWVSSVPGYGNGEAEVDDLAAWVAREFGRACLEHRTPGNGRHWGLLAANISNIAAGLEVGATPDGRLARQPVSDAGSPAFGRDLNGPTGVIRSISRVDYSLLPGGNVVNMKFHPSALSGPEGLAALAALIRTCFQLGGIQLQFNTNDVSVLREAMADPEKHRSLVVRVSGFSAYFVDLSRAVQEDVIARTAHVFAGA